MTAADYGERARAATSSLGADALLSPDAEILRRTVRDAVSTSPDAFLRTAAEIDAMPADYWERQLKSSTWAIMQRENDVLGIAAAKPPDRDEDIEDRSTARYIESVWVAPSMRGNGFGELLVRYLIEMELKKRAGISRFFLWVFIQNKTAIRLYERMGFQPTGREQQPDGASVPEAQYLLHLDEPLAVAAVPCADALARERDWRIDEIHYRLLGDGTAGSKPRRLKASAVESTYGNSAR